MKILRQIDNIENIVSNVEDILKLDIPYYKNQIKKISIYEAEIEDLEQENKKLRALIKNYEKSLKLAEIDLKKGIRKPNEEQPRSV